LDASPFSRLVVSLLVVSLLVVSLLVLMLLVFGWMKALLVC